MVGPLTARRVRAFRCLHQAPSTAQAYAEWVRLTLRICLKYSVGFPWTFDFDRTLGFPGEVPRPQKFTLSDRPALGLVGARGLPAGTYSRRQMCVLRFVKSLATKKTSFDSVAGLGSLALAHSLAKYGQHCYDTGVAPSDYVR